jgi:sugar phosphate isomerase/epimerase
MVALKDFVWEGDRPRWLTLGEGYVPTAEYLKVLHAHGFSGPVSLHFEYNTGSQSKLLEEIRNAVVLLKEWLTEAGYSAPSS